MAQSSAQRDPSMEEILASIRRIIEEGEESRQKPADLHDDFAPTPIGPAANDAMRRPLSPAPELRKDIPAVEPVEPELLVEARTEPESRTVSGQPVPEADSVDLDAEAAVELSLSLDDFILDMEDVQDVREADAPTVEAAPALQAPQSAASEQPKPARIEPELAQPQKALEEPRQPLPQLEPSPVSRKEPDSVSTESAEALSRSTATATVVSSVLKNNAAMTADAAPAATPPALQGEQKPAMLSHAVEQQVAASFTELSEALAASRRRPLDQIAEEMMRPMLQEWLDNNLPTLVERLVREEIERVARGSN